jgi:deazaflavin-dependent oxidoreductase (nitroreductase family)
MSDAANDWNAKIIAEFRANDGKVGPPFEGAPLLLLHTTGAKSGQERVSPVVYQPVGDAWAVFASKAGAPTNPDWFHNLKAKPEASIELGTETVPVSATVLDGAQRDEIWAKQKELMPGFADYEKATTRTIPVVLLTRR